MNLSKFTLTAAQERVELLVHRPQLIFEAAGEGQGGLGDFAVGEGAQGCLSRVERVGAEGVGPGLEEGYDGDASFGAGGELAAGVGEVAGVVVAAGFADPGEVFDAAAFGGEGHDFVEDALLVAGPLGEALDELVAVVADAVAAEEGVLVDVGAVGGHLEEERPVGEGLHGREDGAGLEEGFTLDGEGGEVDLGAVLLAR